MRTCKTNFDCIYLRTPWQVEMGAGEDPVFTFSRMGWKPRKNVRNGETAKHLKVVGGLRRCVQAATVVDPWLVRKKLFSISKPEEALSFFGEFGLWRYRRSEEVDFHEQFTSTWITDCEGEPDPISFSELMHQRNFFEGAVRCGPSEWHRLTRRAGRVKRADEDDSDAELRAASELLYLFGGNISGPTVTLAITTKTLYPHPVSGRITCHEIQDALRATILLDWMDGRAWPKCPTCKQYFKQVSKRPMIYCTPRCSSRARQTEWRKKHRNA